MRAVCAILISVFVFGCDRTPTTSSSAEAEPPAGVLQGSASGGELHAVVRPNPSPIPFGEIFSMRVEIREGSVDGALSQSAVLSEVRAIMPAHNHGMKVEPTITRSGEGTFEVDGMNFHMRGEGDDGLWVLEFVVQRGPTIDVMKIPVQCCDA